jgi:hypothetical protein
VHKRNVGAHVQTETQEYLGRVTAGLSTVRERSTQRRVAVQGEEQDALATVLSRSPLLLLGDPGSGKTTLLEMAALSVASEFEHQQRVPFLVRGSSGFGRSDSSDLVLWLSRRAMFDPPDGLLRHVATSDGAVILIDGLDELASDSRPEAVRRVSRWLVQYANNHWVLSSRPIGATRFPGLVTEAMLQDLSSDEISHAIRRFFENSREADKLQQVVAAHRDLTSLAASPLLLGLMAQIFRDQGRLPLARADLYGSWTDIALRQWDKTRGIGRRRDYLRLDITRRALSGLALRLAESSRFTFEISEWFEAVREFREVDDAAWQSAEITFRENLLGSGIVRSVGPRDFAFAHVTLQEYFASQALLGEDPGDALRALERIPLEGVAAFYADAAPDPMRAARFFASEGRLDDVRRLLDAFPGLGRLEREEVVRLVAERLGIDGVTFDRKPEAAPRDGKDALRMLWERCRAETTPHDRGRAFEEFATALFGCVFKVVDVRRLAAFGEIDLICEVKADSFWIRWPGDCFVECKNLQDAVPVAIANEFVGKCATVRVGLAFLVCAGRLTDPARDRVSRSWSQADGPDMAWIDGADIETWLDGTSDAEGFLKSMVRRASYGTQ